MRSITLPESLQPSTATYAVTVDPVALDGGPKVVHHRLVYRVVMHGVRPGFSRLDVLRDVAHLFGRSPHRVANGLAHATVSRRLASAQAATRMAELLTAAGCSCSIVVDRDPPLGPGVPRSERAAATSTIAMDEGPIHPATPDRTLALRAPSRPETLVPTIRSLPDLGRRLVAAGRALPGRVRADVLEPLRAFAADVRDATHRPYNEAMRRLAEYWTPRVQQFVFAFGALATLALLSNSIPGYSIPQPSARPGDDRSGAANAPLAPVADLRSAERTFDPSGLVRRMHQVRTSAGLVALVPDPVRPRTWALTWNGTRLRDLHVDTTPSIMARAGARDLDPAIGEFGNEVVLVVDTGERRSAYCAASRMLLVVLPRSGVPRLREVAGQCAEVETVDVRGQRLTLHFYDKAAPSLVYESGRLARLVN